MKRGIAITARRNPVNPEAAIQYIILVLKSGRKSTKQSESLVIANFTGIPD